ncbi:regulatory protein, luxR family [Marivirga sericea]|uniref:Regulatory protein, luxR family n=1 Tax=Marivirga sericea TaxID=1028 RepID=A0A1X7JN50_9BACT|nr:LuxR family transcriptional regulator [Marivirga sericea]SMG28861.1 regulatory protein, luxR family [Marivirga sericea]
MIKKEDFFSFQNTVKKLSADDVNQTSNYLEPIKAFARATNQSVYIIDYKAKGFEYVSDNPLFLCGHSARKVQEMGYEFYLKYAPEKDQELLLKINTIGFDFYEKILVKERKDYTISYDFHLKNQEKKSILINQKLTPLFLTEDGKIWKALCLISLSTANESGNICIYKKGGNTVFQYDLKGSFWSTNESISLSQREKEIMQLSSRGFTVSEIAEAIFLSPDTVKFHKRKLFEKLAVSNLAEAIAFCTNNRLL